MSISHSDKPVHPSSAFSAESHSSIHPVQYVYPELKVFLLHFLILILVLETKGSFMYKFSISLSCNDEDILSVTLVIITNFIFFS